MSSKFTVRPKPKDGESFTGYLLRVAHLNAIDSIGILKLLNVGYSKFQKSNAHQLDVMPDRIFDLELMCEMLNLETSQIYPMTFRSAVEKFVDRIESVEEYPFVIYGMTDAKNRRFCPMCLYEQGFYKLMWQVKEIDVCEVHGIELTSACPSCSNKQPFLSSHLASLRCATCGSPLSSRNATKIQDNSYMRTQIRAYEDWTSLLNADKNRLIRTVENYSYEQSLGTTMLWLAQDRRSEYQLSHTRYWTKDYAKDIANMIRGGSRKVTISKVLPLIRQLGLSVTELSALQVPDSFVRSLYPEPQALDVCSAPWCKFHGTNEGMRQIMSKNYFYTVDRIYSVPSVCVGCYMKYGYLEEKWENVSGRNTVDIEIIQTVRDLLNQGCSQNEIRRRLKLHRGVTQRVAGYLAYHKLLKGKAVRKYTPNVIPENLHDCVKQNGRSYSSHGQELAHKLFGWSTVQFFYYMASATAQDYILFDQSSNPYSKTGVGSRKPLTEVQLAILKSTLASLKNSDTPIVTYRIAKMLKCYRDLLRQSPYHQWIQEAKQAQKRYLLRKERKELRNQILNFVNEKTTQGVSITAADVYTCIGHSRSYVKRRHPWLVEWIALLVRRDRGERTTMKKQDLIQRIPWAVENLVADGMNVNAHDIANFLGIPYNALYIYPEVVEAMNQAKLRFNTGYVLQTYR
ncbi:TniQ family protein [Brevibacillus centrosporus]|uniref:TniQ family protein n=1 Tax=Brevibacillus centrosporus TaxID=54910 RepID=UPI003D231AF5